MGMYHLLRRLDTSRKQIAEHSIYRNLESVDDIRIFMEHHVFAVWDFMSLLKSLQKALTCVEVPWVPVGTPRLRRLINEIVLEEETDEVEGVPVSHYELYHRAMTEIGADTRPIDTMIGAVARGMPVGEAISSCGAPVGARAFVDKTFELIASGKTHVIASAFTFGREEPIPDMFRTLVGSLQKQHGDRLKTFITYLDRHIGLDEDHHAPMAVEMLAELCGSDDEKWGEATRAAIAALTARHSLWSTVVSEVSLARMGIPKLRATG
ncbi:DUF3050 domain-containing protein [Bradyrhizobium elkanii]|nr:DUF3050 domain-containing protein [Bradyrhizobium elkanii]QOZ20540.1 DUF3050 domain-containing protein [Bradyrhizobium sp. CCBAU 21365]